MDSRKFVSTCFLRNVRFETGWFCEVPSNAQSAPRAGAEQEPAVPAAAAAPAAPVLKMTPTEGGTAEKSERHRWETGDRDG